MANLRATLSLNSADVLTSAVALSVVSNLDCDSGSLIRAKVKGTAAGNTALQIYVADQCNNRAYLYLRNLDTELEHYVYIYNDTDSNGLVSKIGGGEFAFVPVAVDKKYAVYATRVDTMVEYGVFGNDNSTNPFTGSGDA